MISERAKHGVDFIFTRAARANLIRESSDTIEIERLQGSQIIQTPENRILVLTVASYVFRLLIIFHVKNDTVTESYYSKPDSGRTFSEVFGEIGNLCCGAMNRDLGNYFLHMGMSTPYMLDGKCVAYLNELKPTYISQHRIEINNAVSMHATLCFCAYAPIDFRVDTSAAVEATGELELF